MLRVVGGDFLILLLLGCTAGLMFDYRNTSFESRLQQYITSIMKIHSAAIAILEPLEVKNDWIHMDCHLVISYMMLHETLGENNI